MFSGVGGFLRYFTFTDRVKGFGSPFLDFFRVFVVAITQRVVSGWVVGMNVRLTEYRGDEVLRLRYSQDHITKVNRRQFFTNFPFFIRFLGRRPERRGLPAGFGYFEVPLSVRRRESATSNLCVTYRVVSLRAVTAHRNTRRFSILVDRESKDSVVLRFAAGFGVLIRELLCPIVGLNCFHFQVNIDR